jgi:CheY-specific phosphatase CheX
MEKRIKKMQYDTYKELLVPILDRLKSFLNEDMGIPVLSERSEVLNSEHIILKRNTVFIGTGGSVQLFITIGFDQKVLEELTIKFCEGEFYEGEELIEIQESVACEVSNIVVGNAIRNPVDSSIINITPPVLIHDAKSLAKYKNSMILESKIVTDIGDIQMTAIGPKELFSEKLNLKEI